MQTVAPQSLEDWIVATGTDLDVMAAAINVKPRTLYRYMRRERKPRWRTIELIKQFTRGAVTADSFAGPPVRSRVRVAYPTAA